MSGTLSLTFNVANAPTDANVTLPIVENPSDPITFTIDWGDSTTDSLLTHTYGSNGTYTAVITITSGSVTQFGDVNWQGVSILTAVATTDNTTWGLPGVESFSSAFQSAVLLTAVPTDVPLSVKNMSRMFQYTPLFNQDISGWNVSEVTDMSNMFREGAFNRDISIWDVSKVTTMSNMFYYNTAFNNGGNALTWGAKTTLVQYMNGMFQNATNFNQDITGWIVSNVRDMSAMFRESAFNQNISGWDVSSVTDMSTMFRSNAAFNNGDSGNNGANSLNWGVKTSLVQFMNSMFESASAFNQDISSWNVSSVTNMSFMFTTATLFNNGVVGDIGGKDLNWTTTGLVENMANMFNNADAFNQDISSWNVSSVTSMNSMFLNTALFNNGGVALTWSGTGTSISNVMTDMFNGASAFNQDVSSWNVSNVTNMNGMFYNAIIFNQNVSSWNVSRVTDMGSMFRSASAFDNGGVALTWGTTDAGTSIVTNMRAMFFNATDFDQDVSSWNVSSVMNTGFMFANATSFNNGGAPLTWSAGTGTSIVSVMDSMFQGAVLFDQNIRYWSVVDGTNLTDMFSGATAMAATYGSVPGYGTTPSYTFFTGPPPSLFLTFNVTSTPTPVTLPISGSGVLVSIDWGDGTTLDETSLSHTYGTTGIFSAAVTITGGSVTTFGSAGWGGVAILTDVSTNDVSGWALPGVTSFANAFDGAFLLVSVPTYVPSSVINMNSMFVNARVFNQNISGWNVSSVTDMSSMFKSANIFNQNLSGWNTSSVTDMNQMFANSPLFNNGGVPLTWNTNSVIDMSYMFYNASQFNQKISSWNVSGVTNMTSMLQGAALFNRNIRVWVVGSGTTLTNMFLGATDFAATYGSVPGYGNTPLYTFFTGPYPCFLEGTQILCLENNEEVYRPVESLRKGDLVKTIYNGYLPVHMIGTSPMYNPNNNDRIANRLYKCPKENYPGLLEDLYITGCHSILVPWLTYEQGQKTIASLGRLFVTDKHCRLMAWVDEKAVPYKMEGVYNIYHVALENEDYYMNYGIYANGLLVESCSKRYLMERSNMRILGEEDCSLTEDVLAEENIFHKMPCLIETC